MDEVLTTQHMKHYGKITVDIHYGSNKHGIEYDKQGISNIVTSALLEAEVAMNGSSTFRFHVKDPLIKIVK